MERQIDINAVSDGKLYGLEDMVRADCAGCAGCFACCRGMGTSVVLDPLDIHRMSIGTGMGMESLLSGKIELNVVDGVILPNLKMDGVGEQCAFLGTDGRCTIHPYRPGICRIFPLGRLYEDGGFRYFLQVHECRKERRSKVKVKKWIDTPNAGKYDAYIARWHFFLKDLTRLVQEDSTGASAKKISMYVLKEFYLTPYDRNEDFYGQLDRRLEKARNVLCQAEFTPHTAASAAQPVHNS